MKSKFEKLIPRKANRALVLRLYRGVATTLQERQRLGDARNYKDSV
jgi:hypothetical protein